MPTRRRPARLFAGFCTILLAAGTALVAQSTEKKGLTSHLPPQDDGDFARAVKAWTTRPEFSSPLVDHLPKTAGIPSPKEVLGHHIGEPKKLTYYADILKYYRALAAATARVKVLPIGTSNE